MVAWSKTFIGKSYNPVLKPNQFYKAFSQITEDLIAT